MKQSYRSLRGLLARVLTFLISPVGSFEWSILFSKELDDRLETYPARISTQITPANEQDVLAIVGSTRFHTRDVLLDRYRGGNTCLVARKDGALAGFNWVVFHDSMDACYFINLAQDDVYCMDARTFDDCRGQGLHTELLSRLLIHARDKGCRRAFTRASATNSSSWKSHVRLGWKEAGSFFMFVPKRFAKQRCYGGPDRYPLRLDRRESDNR